MGQSADDTQAAMDEAARLKRVRERFALAANHDKRDDEAAHEDLLMLVGGENQWDERAVRERKLAGRPLYTANRFPAMLAQITGEVRANPPAISCTPADADATPDAAEVFEGLIRSIERLSQGQQVYVETVESSAACGKGHMRIVPIYADDESFDVELRIRAIRNVHSVKWDPAAVEFDKSDANWCIIVSELDRKGFEEAYPQVGAAAWANAKAGMRQLDGWRSNDKVTVAEEWEVVREPFQRYRVAHVAQGFRVDPMTGIPGVIPPTGVEEIIDADTDGMIDGQMPEAYLAQLQAEGWQVVQTRTAYRKKICMYLWGGEKQIAGPIEWYGARIPIFTVPGRQTHVGPETVHYGVIRHSRDAQRLHNYARSADLELVSQAPKSPVMVAEEQIDGHEDTWVLAQTRPVPYLPYNRVEGMGAPQERSGPGTNPGPASLASAGVVDMEDTTGIHGASLGKKSNETSGIAINARDAQTDTGTFVFIYNLRLMVESMGRELVSAIPHYYSAQKQIMILGQDDAPAVMNMAGIDLDRGKYHVIAKTGPAYATRREKGAELLMQMAQAAPPWAQPIIFKRVIRFIDMPDADDFVAELDAVGQMVGAMPPPPGQMPQGMPGAPPMPGQPPSNVIPMPQRGPPQGADPLAGVAPVPPPGVPAARPVVGDTRMGAAPPGM